MEANRGSIGRFGEDIVDEEVADSLRKFMAGHLMKQGRGLDDPPLTTGDDEELESGRHFLNGLAKEGWTTPTWPIEYGGKALPPRSLNMINRVLSEYDFPDPYPFMVGLGHVGWSIIEFGSQTQKSEWLLPIRTGEEIWCQLFSEPGAGSDLAGLSTRAERCNENEWNVSGQKVWCSRAAYATWGFLLARTEPNGPKHEGITAFAIDMATAGIDVRPLRQMNGDTHFSEVFLDSVTIPDCNRIGPIGGGWHIARETLAREREPMFGYTAMGVPIDELLELVKCNIRSNMVALDSAMRVFTQFQVSQYFQDYFAERYEAGQLPSEIGSISKLHMGANMKALGSLVAGIRGPEAMLEGGHWQYLFLTSPSHSIRGGTDQIVRNVLAERVLGLPRERTSA